MNADTFMLAPAAAPIDDEPETDDERLPCSGRARTSRLGGSVIGTRSAASIAMPDRPERRIVVTDRAEPGSRQTEPDLRLYRVAKSNPATRRDFLSFRELGIPLRHQTAKGLRLWDGLSVYRDRDQAAARARRTPGLGNHVVELRIPLDGRFRIELDNGENGHCTIWGDPDALLALVVSIWPI